MIKNLNFILYAVLLLCVFSCNNEGKKKAIASKENDTSSLSADGQREVAKMDKADSLVAKTIAAHGGERYDTAHYRFTFRKKNFTFHHSKKGYTYTSTGQKDGEDIRDVLENGTLTRTVNGKETELSAKDVAKYKEALNSVIYFATLPHKLNDAAVKKSYEGRTLIQGQAYDMLSVTFEQEGGGTDYDDTFMYWVNTETGTIDYLAYSYQTNDGGVRFRSAYDARTVGGIRFQNYINYEAPIDTPLDALPELYEAGKLKELSRIETEDVVMMED
ncbi:MAG: DUF6503 family protein [Pricia sp.]